MHSNGMDCIAANPVCGVIDGWLVGWLVAMVGWLVGWLVGCNGWLMMT
jgi:hypothetical protein